MHSRFKKLILKVIAPLILWPGISVCTHAAQPMIAETWFCSFKEGKDLGDLYKARDFLVAQANKAELNLPTAFLWSLSKGHSPNDFVWFNVHRDITAFGTSVDALQESDFWSAVAGRFASVSDCVSGMGEAEMIFPHGRPAAVPEGSILVVAQSCSLIDGVGREGLVNLVSQMRNIMNEMGANAPIFSTMLQAITARAANDPDVILYSGFAGATGWGSYVRELATAGADQRLRNHIAETLDCDDFSIWSSQRILASVK